MPNLAIGVQQQARTGTLIVPGAPDVRGMALAIHASLLSESLSDFAKAAWHVLEPQTPLKWGWALDAICEHLEAVTDGEVTRLLMNVPPGCMKSLLTGVLWPAWEWTRPSLRANRYLSTAHKQDLAVRDNLKCRRLIQSSWYQARWPVTLVSDQNAKTKFENDRTGFREAMSFTGMTGSRGDRVIVDDPLSVDSGNSEADILTAERTLTETVPTRVNNEASAIVIIMQRIAERDPSAVFLEKFPGAVHLMLPMEFEPERRCKTGIGFVDPRKKDGELLFPDRFGPKQVKELKTTLGEYASAGQLQQRPSPRGGGMFKLNKLRLWPADKKLPALHFVVQSYDTAFTDQTTNDPTASTVWGVFEERVGTRKFFSVILLDAWDEHLRYSALRDKVIKLWKAKYGQRSDDPLFPGRRSDIVLVENKSSGIAILQDLQAARVPAQSYNPGKSDKTQRAEQALPIYDLGLVYVPEARVPAAEDVPVHLRPFVSWARPFVKQLTSFGPGGVVAHDDYVDTFTQVVLYLRDAGWLDLPEVDDSDEPPEAQPYGAKPRNPYD